MRAQFALEGMASANRAIAGEIRKRGERAIAIGGEGLKQELRAITRPALGDRLAKTWRLKTYGMDGRESPAAFVYSKAPSIIGGNMTAGIVVPVAGSRFMAIPTDAVPRRIGGRGAKAKMTPEEVEARFNQELILRPGRKPGTLVGLIDRNIAIGTGRRRARRQRLELMFTFTRSYRSRKTIDPQAVFAKWRRRTKKLLQEG